MNTSNSFRPNICLNLKTGEAWFGAGAVYINEDTTGKFADGTITWDAEGNVTISGNSKFNANGSGYLADNVIRWDTDGNLTIGDGAEFNVDGSGHLASGNISWDTDGYLTFKNYNMKGSTFINIMGGTGISTIFCTNSVTPMKYIYPSTLSTNVSVIGNNQYGCELFIYNDKSSAITVGFTKGSPSGGVESPQ